jgi:hypothetical protein
MFLQVLDGHPQQRHCANVSKFLAAEGIKVNKNGMESRDRYEVMSRFEAFRDQEEGYAPEPHTIEAHIPVFADPEFWRDKPRDGQEIVKFTYGATFFYVARSTFIRSTRQASESFS